MLGGPPQGGQGGREGPRAAVWLDLVQRTPAVLVFLPPGLLTPIKHGSAQAPLSLNTCSVGRAHIHQQTMRLVLPFGAAKPLSQLLQ